MAERLGNLGYVAFGKETTIGVAVIPTVFIPLYKESMQTMINLVDDIPVVGNKFGRYQVAQGNRGHHGDIEVMGEPNSAGYVFDMLMTRGATTGANPYTQPYTMGLTTNSYTMDISTGNQTIRYTGVQASKIKPTWEKDELHLTVSVSAIASFSPRQIASVTGTGPCVVTLTSDYDPVPTGGLVATDLVRFYLPSSGAVLDTSVTSLTGTTLTVPLNVATMIAGAIVYIRPQTPTYTVLTPFIWGKLQFCFGATASAALSATQTRLDKGTDWAISNPFESDSGTARSGGFDPATLPRLVGDATFKIKKFFDTPEDYNQFNEIAKNSCVIRHYAGATNQYELRITLNNLKPKSGVKPNLESNKILYSEIDYAPVYDSGDAQGVDVKVINAIASF